MHSFQDIHVVLMDVEGTTTSIRFVHDVLFPYAAKHLASYVAQHREEAAVQACLEETRRTVAEETQCPSDAVDAVANLLAWIEGDRKHPALKRLQGLIWEDGYRSGGFMAPLYDDVLPCLQAWSAAGKQLAIYSSGSVKAQQLLFAHTEHGDVTHLLSAYFDTAVGQKREAASYATIVAELGCQASQVLFLSDVPAELDAARASGVKTVHVVRPGTDAGGDHPVIERFDQLQLD